MNNIKEELKEYLKAHPIINTHSHHLIDSCFEGYTLDKLLKSTYVNWSGVTFDSSYESRVAYLEKVRYKSYFVWLHKSLQKLYGFEMPLTGENWDEISKIIENAHREDSHHLKILKQNCGYQKIVLDTHWEPGSNNGHPDLFTPTFRIDPFMYGYENGVKDHDSNDPWSLYGDVPDNLTDYISWIKNIVEQKKNNGCVAIKCATAYDRGIDFKMVTKERAERGFLRKNKDKSPEDIKAFQDYLFWQICEIAAEFDLVLQCHTGMGQLKNANANHMLPCVYQMLTKCYHVYLFFCFFLCYYYHRQVRHKTRNKNLICFSFAKEYGQE